MQFAVVSTARGGYIVINPTRRWAHRRQLGPLTQGAQHRGDGAQDQHRGVRRGRRQVACLERKKNQQKKKKKKKKTTRKKTKKKPPPPPFFPPPSPPSPPPSPPPTSPAYRSLLHRAHFFDAAHQSPGRGTRSRTRSQRRARSLLTQSRPSGFWRCRASGCAPACSHIRPEICPRQLAPHRPHPLLDRPRGMRCSPSRRRRRRRRRRDHC